MEKRWPHQSVLFSEVISVLQPRADGCYVDATLGAGGHAFGILENSAPTGKLMGIDRDPAALALSADRLQPFKDRFFARQGNFSDFDDLMEELGWHFIDGILFDLGVSSMQLETPERGFSFLKEGPLDMRFDPQGSFSAAELLNTSAEDEIARILWENGEEPKARQIAAAICRNRPMQTTQELAQGGVIGLSWHPSAHSSGYPNLPGHPHGSQPGIAVAAQGTGKMPAKITEERTVGGDLVSLAGGPAGKTIHPPREPGLHLPARAAGLQLRALGVTGQPDQTCPAAFCSGSGKKCKSAQCPFAGSRKDRVGQW